jgi:hypothetical protein
MSRIRAVLIILAYLLYVSACGETQQSVVPANTAILQTQARIIKRESPGRVIHVLVALCDNENQGIVPVPAHLGRGDDPNGNLYWGAAYGVKTYFSRSPNWEKLAQIDDPKPNVLQRVIFKNRSQNVFLIADAYLGSKMKETIGDFFSAAAGERLEDILVGQETLRALGSSDLIVFVGHNGLMDFKMDASPESSAEQKREAIILACASKSYFSKALRRTGATPLLWTTDLMAPEAYILHDAIEGWVRNESDAQIRTRAAAAYAKYQRISLRASENLLVTGW